MTERVLVRLAAVVLILCSTYALYTITPDGIVGGLPQSTRVMRGLAVVAAFHVGLFWGPDARGWWGVIAFALMIPALLLFGSLVGESISKIARGFPLRPAFAALSVAGAAVHAWQMWRVGRRVVSTLGRRRGARSQSA